MMDRRHPHRPFDPQLIRRFLRGRRLLSAELLPDGKCNSNYRLLLDGGQTVVLRLRSRGDADREAYVMSLARGLVPVPEELDRGDGWSIYTFLEGEPLSAHPEQIGRAAEALARIASVELDAAGWINADGTISPFSFGDGSSESGDFMAVMLADPQVRRWIGDDGAKAIAAIMASESGRMAELGADHRLVHGDFNPTNILVSSGDIAGVLDWEFSHSGTPYMDIGNLLRHTNTANHGSIRDGLVAGGFVLRHDWWELGQLVDISSQLEFLTSSRSDEFKQQCVRRIEGFITRFWGSA